MRVSSRYGHLLINSCKVGCILSNYGYKETQKCQVYYIIAHALQHLERRFCCIGGEEKQTYLRKIFKTASACT